MGHMSDITTFSKETETDNVTHQYVHIIILPHDS